MWTTLRRTTGIALAALVVVPFWRLLSGDGGPGGVGGVVSADVVRLSQAQAALLLRGTILVLVVAGVTAVLMRRATYERWLTQLGAVLATFNTPGFVTTLAVLSGGVALFLSRFIWDGAPPLVDGMAQLVHARYFADGMAAGPAGFPFEFWVFANTFVAESRWISQYPPGHMALLAVGLRLGLVWVVCPILMAVTTLFTALVAERLFPHDRVLARLGAILVAVSLFLISLAAASMNHVTATALIAVAAYCALRARDDGLAWAVIAGAAVGGVFATRPLTAVTVGGVVTVGVWLTGLKQREDEFRYLATRIAASFFGALPMILVVAAYNARFFGSPFRFGYISYLGPRHGLGFHTDPWGNSFGPIEALGYASSDLLALGYSLFRTPISVVLIVGLFLAFSRTLSNSSRLLVAWALMPVLSQAFYWHHDLFLGPRMLGDVAPAWCLLAAVASLHLVRGIPKDLLVFRQSFSPRVFAGAALIITAVVGLGYRTPRDVRDLADRFGAQLAPPQTPFASLVFVHDMWNDRMASKLLSHGMRADSVLAALQQNASCRLHEFVTAYRSDSPTGQARALPAIEFAVGATDGSRPTRLPSGVVVRTRPDEVLTSECLREAQSDRYGGIPLMRLVWQGDLPGLDGHGVMFARDLGPQDNETLMERFPGRRPMMLLRRPPNSTLALVPYDVAVKVFWGAEGRDQ
jgi:hypothetical protein